MVSTRELRGSKEEIARQIEQVEGEIISAILVVNDDRGGAYDSPSEEEFFRLLSDLDTMAVSAPNADYSREAMYTRMPGE